MSTLARLAAALLFALALAACTRITQQNYDRVQEGMSEAEVVSILGKPDESSEVMLLRVKAVNSQWKGGEHTVLVQFVNGRVRAKNITRTGPRL